MEKQYGNVLMTIDDENKQEALELAKRFANIGYGIYATKGTADLFEAEGLYVHGASKIETEDGKNVLDIIRNGRVNFVINTMSNKKNTSADGFLIRRVSAENNISCMTSLDTAHALIKVLESLSFSMISMNEMGKQSVRNHTLIFYKKNQHLSVDSAKKVTIMIIEVRDKSKDIP